MPNSPAPGLEPSSTGQLRFTPRMKEVLTQADFGARWLQHDRHIGTEHLLLGLSGQYEGVAARVLKDYRATPATIRREVMGRISRGYPQEDDQMATSGKTLEAWVGRRDSVAVDGMGNGESGRFRCTLEGIDSWGIVVGYESDATKMTRLFPWHTVPCINLAKYEESEQPPRRVGFSSA